MLKFGFCKMAFSFTYFVMLAVCVSASHGIPKLIDLDEDNWHEMLEGEWMVEFFAPWCPACKALTPVWREFSTWSDDLGISVGHVDVTGSPGLSGRFMVTALPTIFHIKNGVFRQYRGSREREDLMQFIEEKKWEQLEEVPAWKSPGSYQMAVVAQFFKLSMVLRGVHSNLVEDYGLPTWASYLLFAMATIFVGALLGLVLVCIIDFLFPPKSIPAGRMPAQRKYSDSDEEDLIDDKKPSTDGDSQEGSKSDSEETKETGGEEESDKKEEEVEEQAGEEKAESEGEGSPSVRKRKPRKDD